MRAVTEKILIIEDDNGLIELLSEKISESGYLNNPVQNGRKAIEWLGNNSPFLIILDYSLPDMNGNEFIAELKTAGIPIPPFIVSTGQGDERIAVEMMKLGAKDYLIKDKHFLEMIPLVISRVSREIVNENRLRNAEQALIESNLEFKALNEELVKTNEELKLAKDHAEESDRLKTAFLANMSHEIRTPMNGILGFAELLKRPDLTTDKQQMYINIIEKSGSRMLNIINDIIDISKIESGLMRTSFTETNINELIDFIYTFFKPEVEQKGMQLIYSNGLDSKRAIINTDKEKIYAILINLVKNGIKYSDKGVIEFGYYQKGNSLEFYVKDTGIGIPEDRQNAIFERFIQADISDKRAFQGAGLGLAISKAYIEMLGGQIWVESELEKGSTFYFTLPYNSEKDTIILENCMIMNENFRNEFSKLTILIAEDDETSSMLLTELIDNYSKNVFYAKTGVEAVDICRKNADIDLVLMDIKMPDMGGYEATRLIRQFNKDVIIIAQTAFALSGDIEKAIASGCNDYISKPLKQYALVELIKKYFEK